MSKLSDRFKDIIEKEKQTIVEEPQIKTVEPENTELAENLLEKVNSVPYWNEYPSEKQRDMVKNFVKNSDTEDKEITSENLVPYVTGFGQLQNLLDNENVSAVFVNDVNSVFIEIDGRVFNAEMKLSQNMLQYILNMLGKTSESVYTKVLEDYVVDVITSDVCAGGIHISIRKVKNFDIDTLIKKGVLDKELLEFLVDKINNKKRIVIAGTVNSGKSTLLDCLIKSCLNNNRCYLLENSPSISTKSDALVKLKVTKDNYEQVLSIVQKSLPEYILSDLNEINDEADIITLRATSLESAFRALVSHYSDMSEKFAKLKVLNDFDYIIYLENFKITSVAELKPAKTMALSVNVIYER
jgi:hypothetical protein